MKKLLLVVLALSVSILVLTGCGKATAVTTIEYKSSTINATLTFDEINKFIEVINNNDITDVFFDNTNYAKKGIDSTIAEFTTNAISYKYISEHTKDITVIITTTKERETEVYKAVMKNLTESLTKAKLEIEIEYQLNIKK